MQQTIDRWQQQTFLVLWAQKETLEGENNKKLLEKKDNEDRVSATTAEIERLTILVQQKERRKEELIAACAQSDVSREEDRLRSAQNMLS